VPWYLTSSITFYNKSLVKKAGWEAPPKNFAELDTFSKDLQRATAQGQPAYAVMPTIAESGNFLKELARVGVPLYDAQSGAAVFADNGAAKQLQYWVDQYQSHRVPAESITEGHRAAVNQYQSNTLAMLLVGPSFIKILKENAQETLKETGVAPQFPQGAKVVDFSTMLLAVPIKSRHPKEAVDLALFLTNEKNQAAFAEAAPVLPSITKALQAPRYQTTTAEGLEDRARAISAQQLVSARAAYQIRPQQRQLNEIINYYVQSALLGKIHADEAMTQAQMEFNALLMPAAK
jgi:putative chitobiose transport system substrate-binding protein